jgi:hypothetical protein
MAEIIFYDEAGLIYRRRMNRKYQLLVPRTLVNKVIRQNHEPIYAAHPGIKRTYELISLSFWWPAMRKAVEGFILECDAWQKREGDRECTAPLGCLGEPKAPFEMVSMDITGPYPVTPRKNRYLLTFVDHFSKYAEVHPIQDQSAATCAKVFASQIVTRHGSGFKLVTDQGAAFMSSFLTRHAG